MFVFDKQLTIAQAILCIQRQRTIKTFNGQCSTYFPSANLLRKVEYNTSQSALPSKDMLSPHGAIHDPSKPVAVIEPYDPYSTLS